MLIPLPKTFELWNTLLQWCHLKFLVFFYFDSLFFMLAPVPGALFSYFSITFLLFNSHNGVGFFHNDRLKQAFFTFFIHPSLRSLFKWLDSHLSLELGNLVLQTLGSLVLTGQSFTGGDEKLPQSQSCHNHKASTMPIQSFVFFIKNG